jgi:hypothetical protein
MAERAHAIGKPQAARAVALDLLELSGLLAAEPSKPARGAAGPVPPRGAALLAEEAR